MKKLSIEQLEATTGGSAPRLSTCFLGGVFTAIAVGIGFGTGGFWGAGGALLAGVAAANYKGCL